MLGTDASRPRGANRSQPLLRKSQGRGRRRKAAQRYHPATAALPFHTAAQPRRSQPSCHKKTCHSLASSLTCRCNACPAAMERLQACAYHGRMLPSRCQKVPVVSMLSCSSMICTASTTRCGTGLLRRRACTAQRHTARWTQEGPIVSLAVPQRAGYVHCTMPDNSKDARQEHNGNGGWLQLPCGPSGRHNNFPFRLRDTT